jgi:serine/threonine protein kinase
MNKVLNGRYEVLEILGSGGMGCVYKVADRKQGGGILAVKELRAGTTSAEKKNEALAQFQTEARILSRLTHPNLPKVSDYFSRNGAYYLVMEYIQGMTLKQLLDARRGRPVGEELALSWALQICRAMHFLSVQKPRPIVFRDLKPANIMIARDGRVKLIDFGIARFFKENKTEDTYVYGTPGYAAPEQYGTGQTDVRSDIFSLGATLHHCLTGREPSLSPMDFPDPRKLNPNLGRETAAIIKKALEPDRDKRFADALDMKQAVRNVLLDMTAPVKGVKKVIYARPGRVITIPWWRKTSWVSVPVMTLGLSGTTGTLSAREPWLRPKQKTYGQNAARLLFRVESAQLKPGREYRPHIIVKTDAGVLRPRLLFKKPRAWIILEAILIVAAIAAVVAARWG